MKAAGVVAEFNPLHKGHIYHLRKTAELSGCDAVVVAMSGDFVQRGMPAVFDKWTRAGHALRCGADLVIEIPAVHCLADAGVYAGAGVRLLEATGKVSHISFGSECGDLSLLTAAVKASYMDCEAGPREIEDPGKGVILAVLDGKVTGKANSTMVTGGTYVFGFYGEDGNYLGSLEIYQGLLVTDDGMYYID